MYVLCLCILGLMCMCAANLLHVPHTNATKQSNTMPPKMVSADDNLMYVTNKMKHNVPVPLPWYAAVIYLSA